VSSPGVARRREDELFLGLIVRLLRALWISFSKTLLYLFRPAADSHANPYSMKDAESRRKVRISNGKLKRRRISANSLIGGCSNNDWSPPFIAHNCIAALLYECRNIAQRVRTCKRVPSIDSREQTVIFIRNLRCIFRVFVALAPIVY